MSKKFNILTSSPVSFPNNYFYLEKDNEENKHFLKCHNGMVDQYLIILPDVNTGKMYRVLGVSSKLQLSLEKGMIKIE